MRALILSAVIIGTISAVDLLPSALQTALGLTLLAGIFAGSVALIVKWVRNV